MRISQLILATSLWGYTSIALAISLSYSIHGLPKKINDNTQKLLTLEIGQKLPLSESTLLQAYHQAPQIIRRGIEPFGYFHAEIIPQQLKQQDPEHWRAIYQVKLGSPTKVSCLNIQIVGKGRELAPFHKALHQLPLKVGQTFNMQRYDNVKDQLLAIASEQGFLQAQLIQHQVIVDKSKNTCQINLVLDTGEQFYFGPTDFQGSTYSTAFLKRYLTFRQGERYLPQDLLDLQQNLTNSVYFKNVTIYPEDSNLTTSEVPITIKLQERKPKHYTLGVGYGTDTGFRGVAGFDWYHITKDGHYFKSYAQLAQLESSLEARYIIPGKNPATDQYYMGATIEQQDINRNQGDTQKLSIGNMDRYRDWQRTFSVGYQFDHYSINDAPFEQTHNLIPKLILQRNQVDDMVFPRKGYSLSLSTLGAAKALASSSSFVQGALDNQWIFSPGKYSRLLLRGNLGITATDNINLVPLSLQFFAGGAQSIRGYNYEELGPGRYLLVGSIEYQHQMRGKWWGAVFFDAGNAINSFMDPKDSFVGAVPSSSVNLDQILKTSTGFGVVYASPVGPIEITVAKPLNDSNKPVKLQVAMGANL